MTLENYFAPKSVKEAISLLSEYGQKARVISGGTDLLAQMKHREVLPQCVISIGNIAELSYIKYDESKGLTVGVLTSVVDIANSPVVKSKFGILAQAAGLLGTPSIRNQATLGGNLCNAAPSADTAPPLLALEAMAKIAGPGGEKMVPLETFFAGPGQTILVQGQLLTEIQIANLPPHSGGFYLKQTRRHGADLAMVGVAALVVMDGQILKDVRIALGAVAPTPIRARKAEAILRGYSVDGKRLEEAGQAASQEAKPIDDVRSSAEYRKTLVAVLTRRAVTQAIQQTRSEVV
jgi:CO/xanthine dehydrogenase FAD-binding subunit